LYIFQGRKKPDYRRIENEEEGIARWKLPIPGLGG
jgi:hypothetical protein